MIRFIASGALLLVTSLVQAQDRPTRFTADAGFVNVSGNTSVTTLNIGQSVVHTSGIWKVQQNLTALYGVTEGDRSAEQYKFGVRSDAAFSARVGSYALASWDRNEFAGTKRRFEEGVGLAFKALTGPKNELDVEAGVGATQQISTTDISDAFLTGRLASRFKHLFREKTYLQQLVEFIPNFETSDDYRFMTETSLVAPLSSALALKVAYLVRFDNRPEPGFRDTDRTLTTGLQVNW